MYRPDTWHVHWIDLAWLWGFVIVPRDRHPLVDLAVPIDPPAGTDLSGGQLRRLHDGAGRARRRVFFLVLTVILTAWAVVLIVGHIVWGQKF